MSGTTKCVVISKIDSDTAKVQRRKDIVAREAPLHIFLGGIHFVTVLCSPALEKELVTGYLLGEGLIDSVDEIANLDFVGENRCNVALNKPDTKERVVISKPFAQLIVSACGGVSHRSLSELLDTIKLKPLPSWQIEAEKIVKCVRKLNELAETFRKTGGVHIAALYKQDGNLITAAEDIGRHNAVDKVIGAASLDKFDLGECFLALSGRLTGDIVLKTARAGIPIVASLAAAIDSGIAVAEKFGSTLIGFVRGNRMTVYAGSERIKV
ncbi:MAG: formate dehydrogenase accessory sulfurtransferase FdhD [Candidatus Bathyarchaeia archaeon]